MKYFTIQSTQSREILFEGLFPDFKHCIEDAVTQRISLAYANLRGQNLTNANLDDAILPHADLSNANLTGANLSESYLKQAHFDGAVLYNTCLSYSNISACSFRGTSFGATDIVGCLMDGSQFSTLSCFLLNFATARQMRNCIFISRDGSISEISHPPIVINGFGTTPIIVTDKDVRAGHNRINADRSLKIAQKLSMREIRKRLNT